AAVLGHRDHEAVFDQPPRQVGMHPWRPAGAVRDHDQPPVAALGSALPRELKRERTALERLRVLGRRVVDRDGSVAVLAGNFRQTDRGLRRGGEGRREQQEENDELRRGQPSSTPVSTRYAFTSAIAWGHVTRGS